MRVLIDADGCPVTKSVVSICKSHEIEAVIICDTAHTFNIDNVEVITVDKGADSADFRLVNMIQKNDIVVTQDYGLAAMCLARKASVINQNGTLYSSDNIEALLLQRHTARKIRNAGGRLKGPQKRTESQNAEFEKALLKLITDIKSTL